MVVKIVMMETAPNLVLIGPMGAGKTSIGKRLAERLGLAFVDADRALEADAGASIAHIFEGEGEVGFRERERETLARLLAGHGALIATGGGAVLHADNRALMRERGFVVHLHVGVEGQLQRLARCSNRPLLQREDRETVLRELALVRDPLYAATADLHFDTHGLSPGEAISQLTQLIVEHWKRDAAAA